jgi:hypothetical protein
MVLRLGKSPSGTGTQFVLIEAKEQVDEFFIDEQDFSAEQFSKLDIQPDSDDIQRFTQQTRDALIAYRLFPRLSEGSLVNLALSTGILSQALDLDTDSIGAAPTTVASTFDFQFQLRSATPVTLRHNNGQVEIDACFASRRDGKRVLIVIEAKSGRERALAKHKLFYPLSGIQSEASEGMFEIIPVYLRAQQTNSGVAYHIYECEPFGAGESAPCLDRLHIASYNRYRLNL